MAPKRTRNAASSSQPEPQKPVRASTRKRRASDASSVSERPGSSQSAQVAAAPAKRRKTKKGKMTVSEEPDAIVEEEEEEVADEVVGDAPPTHMGEDGDTDIDVSKTATRHVHFGSDDKGDTSTATHKTPHTKKMPVKRRATASPSSGDDVAGGSKRYRTITHRTSLPAILSQGSESTRTVQEHQFRTLREILEDRIERRKKGQVLKEVSEENAALESRIASLKERLAAEREAVADAGEETEAEQERIEAIETEITALNNEWLANRQHGGDDEYLDPNMMVIDSQDQKSYSQLPVNQNLPATPSAHGKGALTRYSQGSLKINGDALSLTSTGGNRAWEAERRRFEDSILALSKEANEATANLQILTIELQSLGFSETEVASTEIIQSIRESFDGVRERLDLLLPGSLPEDASNQEILEILLANVKEFADRLRVQDKEHQEQVALNVDLRVQVEKLIDHLAASEVRIKNLEKQWRELDESSEERERFNDELEQTLLAAEEERDGFAAELAQRQREVAELENENINMQQNVEKLTISLQGYRNEETRLTDLITKMEEDHGALVANMNKEREETVADLENRLFEESTRRGEAETQAHDKQVVVSELEVHISEISTMRDGVTVELEAAKAALVVEREAREQAESDAADKDAQVEDLESRVGTLETELDTLTTQLEELRGHNEAERRQREAAETELDDRNTEIEGLNQRLREQGMEANNLRQKMFEVQQQNLTKVEELKTLASDQDAQYQLDIADEVARRESAEETSRTLTLTIQDLQTALAEVEQRMRDLLADRDTRIAELEDQVAAKDAEIIALQESLSSTQHVLATETASSQNRRDELQASIAALQDTIVLREDRIRLLEREAADATALHDSEMDDRNAAIASLNHRVAALLSQVTDLESEKAGLERRVEAEAEQMLELAGEKEDEIDSLKATIRDKQEKILIVQDKAVESDAQWQNVLKARDEEIAELRTQTETRTTAFEELSVSREGLKKRFQAYIRRSSGVVKNLQEELARAKAKVDKEGEGFRDEGEGLLEELEAMDGVGEMVARKTTVMEQSSSQAAKRGRKRRVYDSGFGAASDGDETLMAL